MGEDRIKMKKLEKIIKGWNVCNYAEGCGYSKDKDMFYEICTDRYLRKLCPENYKFREQEHKEIIRMESYLEKTIKKIKGLAGILLVSTFLSSGCTINHVYYPEKLEVKEVEKLQLIYINPKDIILPYEIKPEIKILDYEKTGGLGYE
jgi:hypothetical protein